LARHPHVSVTLSITHRITAHAATSVRRASTPHADVVLRTYTLWPRTPRESDVRSPGLTGGYQPSILLETTAHTPPTGTSSTGDASSPGPAGRPLKKFGGYAVLIIFAVIYLYPFLIQIATSFKTDAQAATNPLSLIPNPLDLSTWKRIFGLTPDSSIPLMTWLGNSVFITVIVTFSRVFFDSLAGYALSRLHFRGRGAMFAAVLAIMSVPGVALLVPKFLIVTYLGIYDTYAAMILPLLVDAAGIFIMKQFFDSALIHRLVGALGGS